MTRAAWTIALALLVACNGDDSAGDGGTTEAASSGSTGAGSTSTTDSGDAETTAMPTTAGSSEDDGESTGPDPDSGSSETTEAPPDIECVWFEQPGGEREWGRCTPAQSWDDAEDYCVSIDAHLVSFASASDNLFAINVLNNVMEAWIGLNDKATAEVYEWTDGTPYEYMNWEDNQPDDPDARCVAIGVSQRWFDYDCDEARPFVCVRPL